MAVSYVGVTNGSTAAGTSNSLVTTLPSGWAAGDVAVLVGHVSAVALSMSTPAGWTALPGTSWPVAEGSNSRLYAWYRVLQGGDTAPTISVSGAMTGGWECTVYRDASGVAQADTGTASGTSVTLPTLAGVLAGSALVLGAHCRVVSGTIPTNLTPNAAYTEAVDHATSRPTGNANVRMGAGYRVAGSAGSYGGETVTSDVTGSMIGLLVEVTAASADATVVPDGVTVLVVVGSPSADGMLTAAPDGLAAPLGLGTPAASWDASTTPDGVAVPVAVGSPAVDWPASVAPDGVGVPVPLGEPSAAWSAALAPDGLLVAVTLGAPSTAVPGQMVPRPYAGTVVRSAGGSVTRPDTGVVVRP